MRWFPRLRPEQCLGAWDQPRGSSRLVRAAARTQRPGGRTQRLAGGPSCRPSSVSFAAGGARGYLTHFTFQAAFLALWAEAHSAPSLPSSLGVISTLGFSSPPAANTRSPQRSTPEHTPPARFPPTPPPPPPQLSHLHGSEGQASQATPLIFLPACVGFSQSLGRPGLCRQFPGRARVKRYTRFRAPGLLRSVGPGQDLAASGPQCSHLEQGPRNPSLRFGLGPDSTEPATPPESSHHMPVPPGPPWKPQVGLLCAGWRGGQGPGTRPSHRQADAGPSQGQGPVSGMSLGGAGGQLQEK